MDYVLEEVLEEVLVGVMIEKPWILVLKIRSLKVFQINGKKYVALYCRTYDFSRS